MPYSAAGVEWANSGGVYGDDMGIDSQMRKLKLDNNPTSPSTGWNMPKPVTDNVRGGKSKRNNSRKKIRKNRRANKTRRYKK